jgi:hypothetical protein
MTCMRASVCGTMSAADRPCSSRAPTSISAEIAKPQSAEDSAKPPIPKSRILR